MAAANERAEWAESQKYTWEKLAGEKCVEIAGLRKQITNLNKEATPPPFSSISIAPEWLASDVLALRNFLTSETGVKMMKRARALEYATAVAGARDRFHPAHSSGLTEGIGDTLKWIESCASDKMLHELSQATGEQVANQDTSGSEHEDTELLEKYSP